MLRDLRARFAGEVGASPFLRRCYAGAAGIYEQTPRAVAFPRDAADVQVAVDVCRRRGVPLTARGAGSGMAGNNVGRGLVLDVTRHLNGVVAYDPASGRVRVRPGLTYDGLNDFLRLHGRLLPPNPSSGAFCTLGGMVGNNASGMRSVKYGPTSAWVEEVSGVWGTGVPFHVTRREASGGEPGEEPRAGVLAELEALFRDALPAPPSWVTRVVKNSAGLRVWPAWDGRRLDPVELLAGSEGTLAVFTEITLRTALQPTARSLALAAFPTLDALLEAVERVRPLEPSGLEFLDRTFLEPLRAGDERARSAVPPNAEGVLFVELEGDSAAAARGAATDALSAMRGLALPGARLASDEAEARNLWALRRGASPSLARLYPGRVTLQFVEDCAVPPRRLPELVKGLRGVFAQAGVPVVLFGHAGESHVHCNPLFEPRDPALPALVEGLAERVCDLVDRLEGTLSGEHGDGLARAAFASRRFGPAAAFFAAVRRACDPAGVLNPGKILPAPGWRTGSDLRHRPPAPRRRREPGRTRPRVAGSRRG